MGKPSSGGWKLHAGNFHVKEKYPVFRTVTWHRETWDSHPFSQNYPFSVKMIVCFCLSLPLTGRQCADQVPQNHSFPNTKTLCCMWRDLAVIWECWAAVCYGEIQDKEWRWKPFPVTAVDRVGLTSLRGKYLEYNIDQEHLCKDSSGIFVHEGASEYVHSILFSFYLHLSPSYTFSITLIKISFKLISRVISYFRDLHY